MARSRGKVRVWQFLSNQGRIVDHALEQLSERPFVSRLEQKTVLFRPDELGDPADAARDHGDAGKQGLVDNERGYLVTARRQDERIQAGEELRELLARQRVAQLDPAVAAGLALDELPRPVVGGAVKDELSVERRHLPKRADEEISALDPAHLAEEAEAHAALPAPLQAPAGQVDPVLDNLDPRRADPERQVAVAEECGGRDEDVGRGQSAPHRFGALDEVERQARPPKQPLDAGALRIVRVKDAVEAPGPAPERM